MGEGYNLKSVHPGTCTWCVSKKGSAFSAPKVTSFICRIWKCQHWQNARVSEKGRRVRSLLYTVCIEEVLPWCYHMLPPGLSFDSGGSGFGS